MSTLDEDLVSHINEGLSRSGERERLKLAIKRKLELAGWHTQVREAAEAEAAKRNVDSFSPQELTNIILPRAMEMVPSDLKTELKEEIRQFLESHVKLV